MSEDEKSEEVKSEKSRESEDNIEPEYESTPTKMAGMVANIKPFSSEDDDLEEYLNILEHIFIVNDTQDAKKVSCLIGMGGMDIAKSIYSIVQPKKPEECSYKDLRKLLLEYYKPARNVRAERFKFMARMMRDDESLADFIVELKLLAASCDFGTYLDQALSDKLIWAIRDQSIQKQLIDEPVTKKFEEICAKALSIEIISKGIADIQAGPSNVNTNWVGKIKHNYSNASRELGENDLRRKLSKSRSAKSNDEVVICYRCQREGHIAKYCKNSREREWSK